MPARATTESPQRGFTLIELLVTLLVIGLLAGMASLSVGGSGRLESERLQHLDLLVMRAAFAQDEAALSGRDIGLLIEPDTTAAGSRYRYRWLEQRREGWRDLRGDNLALAQERSPEGLQLQLEVEGVEAVLRTQANSGLELLSLAPQIVFFASGEVTPARLRIYDRADGRLVDALSWDLLGRLQREQQRD